MVVKCPHCGAYQGESGKCARCGHLLEAEPAVTANDEISPKDTNDVSGMKRNTNNVSRRRTTAALVVSFSVVVLLCTGLLVMLLKHFGSSETVQNIANELSGENDIANELSEENDNDESEPDEYDDSGYERYNEAVKNLSYQSIMMDLIARKVYKIHQDDLTSPEKIEALKNNIIQALMDNPITSYSDNFIIQMDGDPETFREALNKIQYEDLYQIILEKNKKPLLLNKGEAPYLWMSTRITGLGEYVNPNTGKTTQIEALGCMTSIQLGIEYFALGMQLRVLNDDPSGVRTSGEITWFTGDKAASNIARSIDKSELKFDLVPDKKLILGLTDELGLRDEPHEILLDDEIIQGVHKAYFTADYGDDNYSLPIEAVGGFERIYKSDLLYAVTGSFVQHNETPYFILSYHSYSLKKMRSHCKFSAALRKRMKQ